MQYVTKNVSTTYLSYQIYDDAFKNTEFVSYAMIAMLTEVANLFTRICSHPELIYWLYIVPRGSAWRWISSVISIIEMCFGLIMNIARFTEPQGWLRSSKRKSTNLSSLRLIDTSKSSEYAPVEGPPYDPSKLPTWGHVYARTAAWVPLSMIAHTTALVRLEAWEFIHWHNRILFTGVSSKEFPWNTHFVLYTSIKQSSSKYTNTTCIHISIFDHNWRIIIMKDIFMRGRLFQYYESFHYNPCFCEPVKDTYLASHIYNKPHSLNTYLLHIQV